MHLARKDRELIAAVIPTFGIQERLGERYRLQHIRAITTAKIELGDSDSRTTSTGVRDSMISQGWGARPACGIRLSVASGSQKQKRSRVAAFFAFTGDT